MDFVQAYGHQSDSTHEKHLQNNINLKLGENNHQNFQIPKDFVCICKILFESIYVFQIKLDAYLTKYTLFTYQC